MAKKRKSRKPQGAIPEAPTCNCLLLCDDVLVSSGKSKHVLQGVIGVIAVPRFPAVIGGFVAYMRFSNIYGAQTIDVRFIESADNDRVLFEFSAETPSESGPLGVVTMIVPIPAFRLDRGGRYLFTATSREEVLAQSPILVSGPPEVQEEGS